eukprot:gene28-33_t
MDEDRIRTSALDNIVFLKEYRDLDVEREDSDSIVADVRELGAVRVDYVLAKHFPGLYRARGIAHVWHLIARRRLDCDVGRDLGELTEVWTASAFAPSRRRIEVQSGALVQHSDGVFRIDDVLDFDTVTATSVESGRIQVLRIGELRSMESAPDVMDDVDIDAIDADDWRFSRMTVGYYLSFDAPSMTSSGMCLAHAILPKEEWLMLHGIEAQWPVWGRPKVVKSDNGSDFKPKGSPHYGGHIERLQGTLLKELHDLPGSTFSSVAQKGEYDSEGLAVMTKPADRMTVYLDFLPIFERTIQADGVSLDNIRYYADVLRLWIGAKDPETGEARKHIFRRDPRDISCLWFYDPETKHYSKIPMADQDAPSCSIWEYTKAKEETRKAGFNPSDQKAVFESIGKRRAMQYLHVHEQFRYVCELSDAQRIAFLDEPRWVGYSHAKFVMDTLLGLMNKPKRPRMPNLLLVGDSNNGKTTIIRRFEKLCGTGYVDEESEAVRPILDSLAKVRDDPNEVGEIKRVVNALLQNMDARSGITLGITNHPQLLDPAVWRRFAVQVEVPLPTQEARELIKRSVMNAQVMPPVEVLREIATLNSGRLSAEVKGILKRDDAELARWIRKTLGGRINLVELGALFDKSKSTVGRWLDEQD